MPLTDVAIRRIKPAEKPIRYWDGGGLYLEVTPAGGTWWRLKFRFDGKEKRLSLGVYPETTLKEARDRRVEARKLLSRGIDPSENRKAVRLAHADRAANSFEVVAREWFAKNSPSWAKSHASKIVERLQRDTFPLLGSRPISDIKAPELLAVMRKIEARGAIETAHRALSNCGQVFRYAVATGRAERDPTSDLRGALQPYVRNHFAATTDPKDVGPLLRQLEGYRGTFAVQCALRLAPLVFVRPGELRSAKWADIDLDGAEWRFTVSKTNTPHIVPLAKQALTILRDAHSITGGGEYVFPSLRTPDRPLSDNAILSAMRRMGIPGDQMCGHGFRAMARTILEEVLHTPVELIEHQLAHAVRDPQGRAYNRTKHLPERRKMMQKWADYLDTLKAGGNVIPLRRKVVRGESD